MKKPLPNTKCTVKLRKSEYREEWYLIIESYPVFAYPGAKPSRHKEALNRTVTTPVWDKSRQSRPKADGSVSYKPKRDINGVIVCRSDMDNEACRYADKVRALRQREYDNAALYTDNEAEQAAQNERSMQNFIPYFKQVSEKRHRNSSDSIIINWGRVYELLKIYANGDTILFRDINLSMIENFKFFVLYAPKGGNKSGTISQN